MKIILSPSKTAKYQKSRYLEDLDLLYPSKTKKILAQLRKKSKKDLGLALNITGDLLNQAFHNIKNYSKSESYHAFVSFDGLVYKNLNIQSYQAEEFEYIKNHVRVLDALYGVLEPGTLIKPYRLDMKAKLGLNLYKHWNVDTYFDEEMIINLASTEFSKMISKEMITIHFLQNKNGAFVNQATYSKMARGIFLDYMIQNKSMNIEDLKNFNIDGYKVNNSLSDANNIVFTR